MILDVLENAKVYSGVSGGLTAALKAIAALPLEPYPAGRNEVAGNKLYINACEYDTKELGPDSRFEAHRAYIDVMYMVEGEETIYVKPVTRLTNVLKPYDPAVDALLAAVDGDGTPVHLTKGQFVVLFPGDAHCPACRSGSCGHVKKLICKLAVDY